MSRILIGLLLLVLLLAPAIPSGSDSETPELEDPGITSVEQRRLLTELKENQLRQQQQLQELENREMALKLLQDEVDKKLDELQRLRLQVEKLLAEKDAREQAKVEELAQMYNRMDSARAAAILQELDQELAVAILGGMKARSAGKVLAGMEGEKAARISQAYSTLKQD